MWDLFANVNLITTSFGLPEHLPSSADRYPTIKNSLLVFPHDALSHNQLQTIGPLAKYLTTRDLHTADFSLQNKTINALWRFEIGFISDFCTCCARQESSMTICLLSKNDFCTRMRLRMAFLKPAANTSIKTHTHLIWRNFLCRFSEYSHCGWNSSGSLQFVAVAKSCQGACKFLFFTRCSLVGFCQNNLPFKVSNFCWPVFQEQIMRFLSQFVPLSGYTSI